ncbi:hypothetical protein DMN91_006788 [Ooceraea biroi]|uniref:Large ribosomal subunit protein mL49 n=1 Tax=Ooceraea biroi TaxID=2015173 RepID=A0A3L8DIJ9_OOCBI|nr:probable 39S ribosomal protein L49, mitochondrial isoform X1 [Ooceraea biroi]RLU20181.1 hypothetical protein DMN91_006788 [Ooceraea biroi]
MAALRVHARGSFALFLNSARSFDHVATSRVAPVVNQIQQRWSSYKSSSKYKSPGHYTDYEITSDPNEWKYVERTLRYQIIPKPPTGDVELSSGYKPACASPKDRPYFIERTKNYMQPVYLVISHRGTRRITRIKNIQGDIWKLERELIEYLEKRTGQRFATQIHEFAGVLRIRGDYVNRVKGWMDTKGL